MSLRSTVLVGFEVFTAVVMKSVIFWDMTPCSPLSFNRYFGGTYRLHLQGRRNKFSKQAGGNWGGVKRMPKHGPETNDYPHVSASLRTEGRNVSVKQLKACH
jgi:hypothetical protein